MRLATTWPEPVGIGVGPQRRRRRGGADQRRARGSSASGWNPSATGWPPSAQSIALGVEGELPGLEPGQVEEVLDAAARGAGPRSR